jgi:hypothetical protein
MPLSVGSSHNDSRLFSSTSATLSLVENLPRLQAAPPQSFHAMPKTFDWATVGTTGRRTFVSEPHIGSSAGLMTSRFDHHKAVLMLMAIWNADRVKIRL